MLKVRTLNFQTKKVEPSPVVEEAPSQKSKEKVKPSEPVKKGLC